MLVKQIFNNIFELLKNLDDKNLENQMNNILVYYQQIVKDLYEKEIICE